MSLFLTVEDPIRGRHTPLLHRIAWILALALLSLATVAQAKQTVFTTQSPALADVSDGGTSYELGMKFQSAADGYITAIRYFKSPSETGTHEGRIWASTGGAPLATVTFTNETASGWQEQALDTPLNIQPNTTYVVSVNANSNFAFTSSGLATSIVNGDLSSVADGNNGIFGSPGTFPTSSWNNSNYFRDILFVAGPIISGVSGDIQTGEAGSTLANPLVIEVRDANGNPQPGTTVDFTVTSGGGLVSPNSAVTDANGQAGTTLTLGGVAGANTVSAAAAGIGSISFSATATPATAAATQIALTPASVSTNPFNPVNYQATIQDQFGNPVTTATDPVTFSATGVTGTFSPGATVTPSNGVASVTFTPTSSGTATMTASATGLADGTGSLTVGAIPDQTVFTSQIPSLADTSDGGTSYELGMKVQSAAAGYIKAIRYFKSPSETGTHEGRIWSSAGVSLATVTFSNETASGWQEQALDTPLSIQPNTTYVVSVNANSNFAFTSSGLATTIVNGDLSSLADGNNGIFGSPGTFPASSWNNSNYFRDIVFFAGPVITKASGDSQSGEIGTPLTQPMAVEVRDSNGSPLAGTAVDFAVASGGGSISPASAVTDANGQASTTLTLGTVAGPNAVSAAATGIGSVTFTATATSLQDPPTQVALTPASASTNTGSPISYQATIQDQFGNPVTSATNPVTFSVTGVTGSFSPSATVTPINGVASVTFTPTASGTATMTASATGLTDGTASLTVGALPDQTVFTGQLPALPDVTDNGTSYEMGMKFQSAAAGHIKAIRYYKSPSEPGTHQGRIWTSAGVPLATVTFTNETASGWQEQALDTPLSIQPNITYVVSVNANSYFAYTNSGLATTIVNGDLSTIADGNNGVYGTPGTFPAISYQNSNYFRDIAFFTDPIITKANGDNQSGEIGTPLTQPMVVEVRDSNGSPLAGTSVDFAVTSGGGSISPARAVTDANGQASTTVTLGTAAGPNTVSATATGIGSVTFTATATSLQEPPTQLALTPASASTNTGSPISYQAAVQDQFGNPVTSATGAVTFSATGATGTFSPSATVTPINGVASATFTPSSAGTATVTASSPGLASGTGSLTVTDLQLSILSGNNQTGTAGTALNNPLVVQVLDNSTGVPAAGVSVSFSATAGDGTVSPATSVTDSTGQASTLLILGTTPGTNSVTATTTEAGSVTFTATGVGSDNTITKVSGDNQLGNPGEALSNPLVVEVRDVNNNPLAGVTVTFNLLSGTGSFSPITTTTNASGQASTILTLGAESGVRTINATAATIGSVTFTANTPNAIVLENQKPGDPGYELVRSGYTETDIVGYADATSVTAGDILALKVSMAQPGDYSIDVFRFGYYGGDGARLVTPTIGPLNGITQPDCQVTEPETRLVECQWSTSYSLAVGNDWTSGLYMARLWDETTGKQHPIFFVVRDDSSTADIIFQSSFTTSLAYGSYGTPTERYSLYGFNSTGGQRALKVSFDRPSTEFSEYSNLLRYEYNMIRWLESQGYNVSYITNVDVHENPASLLQHKVFLSVGHDEYWSLEMRDGVEAARDMGGVNLGFFSANTAYWRVRFEPSSSGQPNRVMACYKDPFVNDPVEPTYLWRGAENSRPENALMGVMYTGDHNALYGGSDFVVSQSSDSYFNNTGLLNNDWLSALVGYEWDAVVNNGFSPPGLVVLSESQVSPSTIAPELPAGTDTSIANAVKYTASSGAKVFSTGSIQWVWGLDSDWVDPPRDDARAKQFAVNLFADFGVRPATPDPGLIIP